MISYNLNELTEADHYRWQLTKPANITSVPTGEVETATYNGTWEQCKARGQWECAGGSQTKQVQAVVESVGGGMARLTVTYVYFDGSPPETGEGNATAGSAGSNSDNPEISINIVSNQLSILTHPAVATRYDSASKEWMALKMFSQGADMNAVFSIGSGADLQTFTVGEGLADVDSAVMFLVGRQSSYYEPSVEMTVSYTVDGEVEVPDVGSFCKIAQPEGGASAGGGRNWLLLGGGIQIQNGVSKMVKKYLLSAPGGWDQQLYG